MDMELTTPNFKAKVKNKGYRFAVVVERKVNGKPYRASAIFPGAIEALRYVIEMKQAMGV